MPKRVRREFLFDVGFQSGLFEDFPKALPAQFTASAIQEEKV
jgi:hypothetical protein